jgi:hypothetical protein
VSFYDENSETETQQRTHYWKHTKLKRKLNTKHSVGKKTKNKLGDQLGKRTNRTLKKPSSTPQYQSPSTFSKLKVRVEKNLQVYSKTHFNLTHLKSASAFFCNYWFSIKRLLCLVCYKNISSNQLRRKHFYRTLRHPILSPLSYLLTFNSISKTSFRRIIKNWVK